MNQTPSPRSSLEIVLQEALESVEAAMAVRRHIGRRDGILSIAGRDIPPNQPIWIVALGKAAAPMAAVAEELAGGQLRGGCVVTKDGHALGFTSSHLEVRETAHPIPDERGASAGRAVLDCVRRGKPDSLLLVLLSGGASALASLPVDTISQDDLALTNRLLLESGADIAQVNAVRKHLSAISGGRLAERALAGRIEVLAISDVPGDQVDVIGSGPCVPDPSRYVDAIAVLNERGLIDRVPSSVRQHLQRGAAGEVSETPKAGSAAFDRVRFEIIARNADAISAAANAATRLGARSIQLPGALRGEVRRMARLLAGLARSIECGEPVCLIAGGETTVELKGPGSGGRNQELALAAAIEFAQNGDERVVLLAVGTDGTDGPTTAAGAFADSNTVARGSDRGASAESYLERNDSHSYFRLEGGLLTTGPTGTNVMDLALLWILPS